MDEGEDGCPDGVNCDDTDPTVYPGAGAPQDGTDNDCDGEIDEGTESGIDTAKVAARQPATPLSSGRADGLTASGHPCGPPPEHAGNVVPRAGCSVHSGTR